MFKKTVFETRETLSSAGMVEVLGGENVQSEEGSGDFR